MRPINGEPPATILDRGEAVYSVRTRAGWRNFALGKDPFDRDVIADLERGEHRPAPPDFRVVAPDAVEHVPESGYPDWIAVTMAVIESAPSWVITWDGAVLTLPGRLRYQPVAYDRARGLLYCRKAPR